MKYTDEELKKYLEDKDYLPKEPDEEEFNWWSEAGKLAVIIFAIVALFFVVGLANNCDTNLPSSLCL